MFLHIVVHFSPIYKLNVGGICHALNAGCLMSDVKRVGGGLNQTLHVGCGAK